MTFKNDANFEDNLLKFDNANWETFWSYFKVAFMDFPRLAERVHTTPGIIDNPKFTGTPILHLLRLMMRWLAAFVAQESGAKTV